MVVVNGRLFVFFRNGKSDCRFSAWLCQALDVIIECPKCFLMDLETNMQIG